MIETGDIHRHARKSLQVYGERRMSFSAQLREHVLTDVDFEVPEGGLAFWLRLKDHLDPDRIDGHAKRHGPALLAPTSFGTVGSDRRGGLRLGFASLSEPEFADGVRCLAATLRSAGPGD